MRVSVLSVGPVEGEVLDVLARRLPELLPVERVTVLGDVLRVPREAYEPRRRQYMSRIILSIIEATRPFKVDERVLGVTDVDLYAPGLNFVFGEALAFRGPAIISTHRLRPEYYGMRPDRGLFLERVLKEAVHELGHTFGLGHCADPRCVMFFSNSILDTDRKRAQPCRGCHARILEKIKASSPPGV